MWCSRLCCSGSTTSIQLLRGLGTVAEESRLRSWVQSLSLCRRRRPRLRRFLQLMIFYCCSSWPYVHHSSLFLSSVPILQRCLHSLQVPRLLQLELLWWFRPAWAWSCRRSNSSPSEAELSDIYDSTNWGCWDWSPRIDLERPWATFEQQRSLGVSTSRRWRMWGWSSCCNC